MAQHHSLLLAVPAGGVICVKSTVLQIQLILYEQFRLKRNIQTKTNYSLSYSQKGSSLTKGKRNLSRIVI